MMINLTNYQRYIIRLFVAALLVFILASCGPGSQMAEKGEKELKGVKEENIQLIQNTETPLNPHKQVLFEKELTIGGQDRADEITMYKPFIICVDQNRDIYVCDAGDQTIKVFDNQGGFKRTIGRKGKGPAEFTKITNMAILPSGRLLVLDYGNRRTSIIDPNGTLLKNWKWQNNYHLAVYLSSGSYIVADKSVYRRKMRLFITKYDFSGKEILSYGEFTPQQFDLVMKGGVPYPIYVPHSKQSYFAGFQKSQWLYHGLNNKYLIEVYDKNGKLFRKISRPGYKPLPYTQKDAEHYYSLLEKIPNKDYVKLAKKVKLPKFKAVLKRLLVDDQGNLWVHTNETRKENDGYTAAYDIFNQEGIYETRIWCDIYPLLVEGGKAYSIETSKETGALVIRRYAVKWMGTE